MFWFLPLGGKERSSRDAHVTPQVQVLSLSSSSFLWGAGGGERGAKAKVVSTEIQRNRYGLKWSARRMTFESTWILSINIKIAKMLKPRQSTLSVLDHDSIKKKESPPMETLKRNIYISPLLLSKMTLFLWTICLIWFCISWDWEGVREDIIRSLTYIVFLHLHKFFSYSLYPLYKWTLWWGLLIDIFPTQALAFAFSLVFQNLRK